MARTVIRPDRSFLRIDWREIWHYRDLLWFLVKRDFTAIYKQSVLGPLWFVLQPLATTLVFTVVFGNIAKIGTDGMPPFLFYMSGMVLWTYFQSCMDNVANALITNASVLGKVYFPRLIVPLSIVTSYLGQLAINFSMFACFLVYYAFFTSAAVNPNVLVLVLPLIVLQCGAIGMGVGLWLSAATAKYRDLRFAIPFLSQLWLYATPIVYPSSLVPERWHWLLSLNPMAGVVELNRYAFLGTGTLDIRIISTGWIVTIVLLVSGVLLFNKVQKTFVDTI
jgi:lipopolysaccharide transport system permease protein